MNSYDEIPSLKAIIGSFKNVGTAEDPWFYAKDVCDVLKIDKLMMMNTIDKQHWRFYMIEQKRNNDVIGIIISKVNLDKLLDISKIPEAIEYQVWKNERLLNNLCLKS